MGYGVNVIVERGDRRAAQVVVEDARSVSSPITVLPISIEFRTKSNNTLLNHLKSMNPCSNITNLSNHIKKG